jgi:hypothetical protein
MLRSIGKLFGFTFTTAVICLAVPAWADTTLYSTGFENPPFTVAGIVGQDGWNSFGPGFPVVENFFADTGSQAVFLDGSVATQSGPYHADTSSGPLIDLSADLAIFTASTQTEWQFGALGPGLDGFLGGINILPDGSIYALTAGATQIGTFTYATAFDSSAFDITTQTYDISVGGVTLASNVPFCGSNTGCTGATLSTYGDGLFDSFGGGNDSGYMDNYSVTLVSTSVPEPSSVLLLLSALLGGIGIELRRRSSARIRAAGSSV